MNFKNLTISFLVYLLQTKIQIFSLYNISIDMDEMDTFYIPSIILKISFERLSFCLLLGTIYDVARHCRLCFWLYHCYHQRVIP